MVLKNLSNLEINPSFLLTGHFILFRALGSKYHLFNQGARCDPRVKSINPGKERW